MRDEDGEHEYELYNVVMHSGTAAIGHYFAYLKNFNDNSWYSFNDQRIHPVSNFDIIFLKNFINIFSTKLFSLQFFLLNRIYK